MLKELAAVDTSRLQHGMKSGHNNNNNNNNTLQFICQGMHTRMITQFTTCSFSHGSLIITPYFMHTKTKPYVWFYYIL